MGLVHRARRSHSRVEFDLAKCPFIAGNILLQQPQQRFRLLRAQINPLEIPDFDLRLGLLLQSTEDQKEVSDVHLYLHAVRVILMVRRVID